MSATRADTYANAGRGKSDRRYQGGDSYTIE